MTGRSKPEPKRRRVSREYESFVQDISEEIDPDSAGEMEIEHPETGTSEEMEIVGDDEKTVRIWPDLKDRIIEEIR